MIHVRSAAVVLAIALAAGVPLELQAQQGPAQTPQALPAQAAPVQAPPPAIPAADIVVRAEADSARLRALRSGAEPDPAVEDVAARIAETLTTRDQLVADSSEDDPSRLTRRELLVQRERWTRYKEHVDNWQSTLAKRTRQLGADQDALALIRAVWDETARAAEGEDYSEVAIRTITSIRAAVSDTGAAIRQRLDAVLVLQDRVGELAREAADALSRIDAAESEVRRGLLSPEQPPIWTAIRLGHEDLTWMSLAASTRRELEAIAQFAAESRKHFIRQGVVLAFLLVLLVILGRRAKASAERDPEIAQTARLFGRPVSVTLLIALITMRLFHPGMPSALVDVGRLLGLIPLLRLLPMLLTPVWRKPVYAFAVLWMLQGLANLLPGGSALHRTGALAVTLVSLAAFVVFLRRADPTGATPGTERPIMRLMRLGAVGLAVSAAANTLGFVDLAALLTSGTLLSVLIACAAFAGAAVAQLLWWWLLRTRQAQAIPSVRHHTELLMQRIGRATRLVAVATWAAGTLDAFELLRPAYGALVSALTTPAKVGSLSISLGNVAAFFIAIWLATLASRFTRFILEEDVLPRLTLPRGVPGAITKMAGYLIIGLGLTIAVGAAGIDLSNLALMAGALGVGIGFGLQTIVSNFVSGLILIFERPVQVGDTIQMDALMGTVKDIGIRASTVRTFDGAEVLVPNADLIAGRVVNWTLSDRLRRVEISVGVAYGSNPRQVRQILLDVVKAIPDSLAAPEPVVLFSGFGESSLNFDLRFWTANFDRWVVTKSDATYAIHDAFKEAGITIPFPQRDVHVRSLDPSVTVSVTAPARTAGGART